MRLLAPISALLLALSAAPVAAQTAPAGPGTPPAGTVGSTVDGGLPEKTGSTTATGQTKPPGDALGAGMGTRPDLEQKSKQLDRTIDTGICSGCK